MYCLHRKKLKVRMISERPATMLDSNRAYVKRDYLMFCPTCNKNVVDKRVG